MTKVIVDFYSVEVKYTGNFVDYLLNDFFKMARAEQEMRGDFSPARSEEMDEEKALNFDGQVRVSDYPCNKLAYVMWAFIREKESEES